LIPVKLSTGWMVWVQVVGWMAFDQGMSLQARRRWLAVASRQEWGRSLVARGCLWLGSVNVPRANREGWEL